LSSRTGDAHLLEPGLKGPTVERELHHDGGRVADVGRIDGWKPIGTPRPVAERPRPKVVARVACSNRDRRGSDRTSAQPGLGGRGRRRTGWTRRSAACLTTRRRRLNARDEEAEKRDRGSRDTSHLSNLLHRVEVGRGRP
jgi:hypothetical protein